MGTTAHLGHFCFHYKRKDLSQIWQDLLNLDEGEIDFCPIILFSTSLKFFYNKNNIF